MQFTTNRNIFSRVVDKVAPALVTGKTPSDLGQYLVLRVDPKAISAEVIRDGIHVLAILDKPDVIGMTVKQPGQCSINGKLLQKALSARSIDGEAKIEFKPHKKAQTPESILEDTKQKRLKDGDPMGDAEEAEMAAKLGQQIAEVGKLSVSLPGPKGRPTVHGFLCVDHSAPKGDDKAGGASAVIPAAKFVKYIQQMAMAVGPSSLQKSYSMILIRINGDGGMTMATCERAHMALANFPVQENKGEGSIALSYEMVAAVSKMCNEDSDIKINIIPGPPGKIVFTQVLTHGNAEAGRTVFSITSSGEEFPEYQKTIKGFDWKWSCKFRKQHLHELSNELEVVANTTKARMIFDTEAKELSFSKVDDKTEVNDALLPCSEATNKAGIPFEADISSRHLYEAVTHTEANEMELFFSGKNSMAMLVVDEHIKMYFSPYK